MSRRVGAEFVGTMFLLMIVVGSGVMGEDLASGNAAIALLANSIATGVGLFVLIRALGPISGAHFNPVVSLSEVAWKRMNFKEMALYWLAQFSGAAAGVFLAHVMFAQAVFQISTRSRFGLNLWISEAIATLGLISTIALVGRRSPDNLPVSVGAYVLAAYWFTSSTSFANPAVTAARSLTNTFCGIAPASVVPFVLAQGLGGVIGIALLARE